MWSGGYRVGPRRFEGFGLRRMSILSWYFWAQGVLRDTPHFRMAAHVVRCEHEMVSSFSNVSN